MGDGLKIDRGGGGIGHAASLPPVTVPCKPATRYGWTPVPSVLDVARRAARETGVPLRQLLDPRAFNLHRIDLRRARDAYLATVLIAREHRYSLPRIGRRLGGRDHTTILAAARSAAARSAAAIVEAGDDEFRALLKAVRGQSDRETMHEYA